MAGRWRCLTGRHEWRKFESPRGEVGAKCRRCGKVDWNHYDPPHMSQKWNVPPSTGSRAGLTDHHDWVVEVPRRRSGGSQPLVRVIPTK
jgi:hypothetical protein